MTDPGATEAPVEAASYGSATIGGDAPGVRILDCGLYPVRAGAETAPGNGDACSMQGPAGGGNRARHEKQDRMMKHLRAGETTLSITRLERRE